MIFICTICNKQFSRRGTVAKARKANGRIYCSLLCWWKGMGEQQLGNKHAERHRMSGSAEYKAWEHARSRCYNKKNIKYPLYGGRGIRMCESWKASFDAFFGDMGRKPTKKHTLDRIDSDGDYEPGNCRWTTYSKQNNNRPSYNRTIIVNGEILTVAQAAALIGIPHATILSRIDSGRSDKEAVSLQKLYGKKSTGMARKK